MRTPAGQGVRSTTLQTGQRSSPRTSARAIALWRATSARQIDIDQLAVAHPHPAIDDAEVRHSAAGRRRAPPTDHAARRPRGRACRAGKPTKSAAMPGASAPMSSRPAPPRRRAWPARAPRAPSAPPGRPAHGAAAAPGAPRPADASHRWRPSRRHPGPRARPPRAARAPARCPRPAACSSSGSGPRRSVCGPAAQSPSSAGCTMCACQTSGPTQPRSSANSTGVRPNARAQ